MVERDRSNRAGRIKAESPGFACSERVLQDTLNFWLAGKPMWASQDHDADSHDSRRVGADNPPYVDRALADGAYMFARKLRRGYAEGENEQ